LERIPITRAGYESLKQELQHLKTVERPNNIKAIEEARAHGDLSENAEFHAAKERQSFIVGRVSELGYKLGNADIIDIDNLPKDRLVFGCRAVLENVDTGESVEYMLVGPDESDIDAGLISVASPLGLAMIGKEVGEEVIVAAPAGRRVYEIVDIV
jgi:transcription elongation factor GreA